MRQFVAGVTEQSGNIPGLQVLRFWMRFPVTDPRRRAFYKTRQQNIRLQAPDSTGSDAYVGQTDAQELADFQNGLFYEVGGYDILDTTAGQSITDRLTRLYALAQTATTASDNAQNQFYGSYFDGSWHVFSA